MNAHFNLTLLYEIYGNSRLIFDGWKVTTLLLFQSRSKSRTMHNFNES